MKFGLALLLASTLACGSDEVVGSPVGTPDATPASVETPTHYVTSSVTFGTNSTVAAALAFDLDGNNMPDNKLGPIFISLGTMINVNGMLQSALAAGTFVVLHSLHAASLENATTAEWYVIAGVPQTSPDLTSGHGSFQMGTGSKASAIAGSVTNRRFAGGPATLSAAISLFPDAAPVAIQLLAARISADLTADGCTNGRLGGAIPKVDIDDRLLPAMTMVIDGLIGKDGTCRQNKATCSASNLALLGLFDANGDQVISLAEVKSNGIIVNFTTPDVDLLGADGKPGHDGTPDAVSVALGFSCTSAVFTENP